jgi:hypothetical protein
MAIGVHTVLAASGVSAILFVCMCHTRLDLIHLRSVGSDWRLGVHDQGTPSSSGVATAVVRHDANLEPAVFFVDVEAGPAKGGPNNLGVPISIFGKGFGSERGNSTVTIGDSEAASYLVWGTGKGHNNTLDMIVVQPGPRCKGGPITVTVNGKPSNSDHSFVPNSGNIYFIAPNGSDSKRCSLAAPCSTIANVVPMMKPGDSVLLRGGSYAEGEIWIRAFQSGTPGHPKVIKSYPGEQVYLSNGSRGFTVDADYVTVSGLNFQNGKSLSAVAWASRDQHGDKFIDNTFAGVIGWAAVGIVGHDQLLAGNVCDVSDSSVGTMGHCFYVSDGNNLTILYNIARGAPGYGLHIYDEQRSANDFQRIIRNVVVEGNILRESRQRSGMVVAMSDSGGYGNYIENVIIKNNIFAANSHAGLVLQGVARNVKVYNNTFYQNGCLGLYVENDSHISNVDIRNNLIYQSVNSNSSDDCGGSSRPHVQIGAAARDVTLVRNSYNPGPPLVLGAKDTSAITGDIHFVGVTALDFHVQPPSGTIDSGLTLPDVPTDYDGKRRPQGAGYDIGAFEK